MKLKLTPKTLVIGAVGAWLLFHVAGSLIGSVGGDCGCGGPKG